MLRKNAQVLTRPYVYTQLTYVRAGFGNNLLRLESLIFNTILSFYLKIADTAHLMIPMKFFSRARAPV